MSDPAWLRRSPAAAAPKLRLLCCPHAGGGASGFAGWSRLLPPEVEVLRLQLPGRENNAGRPAFRHIDEIVPELTRQLRPLLDLPVAFYGHSMGAIVAFDLARRLRRLEAPLPVRLFVSGRRAPQLPLSQPKLHALAEVELIPHLRRMGGVDGRIFERPDWLALFLPTIRADLEVSDLYLYHPEPPLPVPILAFNGADDYSVADNEWAAWAEQTSAGFRGRALPGSHFFDRAGTRMLIEAVADELRLVLAGGGDTLPEMAPAASGA